MPDNSLQSGRNTVGDSVTTASHMAEALGYLARVALDAGMKRIAVKLIMVRTELLMLANGTYDSANGGERENRRASEGGAESTRKHRIH